MDWRGPGGQGVAGGACVNMEAPAGSCEQDLTPAWSIYPSLNGHERRRALVLDQDHQECRRLGRAGVPVHDMHIVGAFIEGLSWCQCDLLSTLHLLHHGALQDVHHRRGIVYVDRARPAGRMLDDDHQHFLAGMLRQIFRQELRDLRLLSHRRAGHEAEQHQRHACRRHRHLFRASPETPGCNAPLGPVAMSRTDGVSVGTVGQDPGMPDQARACERRSHASRPMRPRRASPNGTSERSSTRPPQYRAPGSRTTARGSPTAVRERATMSLNGARSGPAISTMPLRGAASATSATMAATSSAASRWRPEVSKNASTALSSNEGELARSTTTCVPATASVRPSPVRVLTPVWGEAAMTSWPPWRSIGTVFEPIRPVPPMTTIFMIYPPVSMRRGMSHAIMPQSRGHSRQNMIAH